MERGIRIVIVSLITIISYLFVLGSRGHLKCVILLWTKYGESREASPFFKGVDCRLVYFFVITRYRLTTDITIFD